MKAIKTLSLASAALMAALSAGCDNKPATATMPEVNDENCKPENVAKADVSVRQQFADACARRGSFKPSAGKTY